MFSRFLTSACAAAILCCTGFVFAQHEGDVEFEYLDNAIELEGGEPSVLYGGRVYDGAFPVGGFFDRFTSDPGFEAHHPIGPGDVIGFDLWAGHHGHFLHYFDPGTNSISSAHPWSMNISWGAGDIDVSANGGGSGLIGQADGAGLFHIHPDFQLSAGTPFGAYGILMSLNTSASGVADSDPFWIIFNFGMEQTAFEAATRQFTGIPEPSAAMLLGLGAVAIAGVSRRRRI